MSEHEYENEHKNNNKNELNLSLIPYKNIHKCEIKKYHIVDSNNKIIKYKLCNIFAPFGREADYNKFNSSQQRFNICFSQDHIKQNNQSYIDFTNKINAYENYFKEFDELKEYELISNIINRDLHGIVIRCHLKTLKDKTTTTLTQIKVLNQQTESNDVEWIDFNKNEQFNMEYCFDCLWIDETNKKFGVSIKINSICQFVTNTNK